MSTVPATQGSTQGWVLNPNVEIVKTTKIVTENGVSREITTYTGAPKQPVGDSADYLKQAGAAFLALGLIGLVYSRFIRVTPRTAPKTYALKRQILITSCVSILAGVAMFLFSRSMSLQSK